jgi:hypothetical protein
LIGLRLSQFVNKRQSCSSLFRKSKIKRGCQSYTVPSYSSSYSESVDINEISDSTPSKEIEYLEQSESSFSNNYVAMEFEEADSNYQELTFESKPSSTYIDSNEEFMY